MKKLFLFISVVCILTTLFTMNVLAKDIEISKCDVNDPVCQALQEAYGEDSTVLYSATQSAACSETFTIEVNGETTVIYVSAQPADDNEVIAPPPVGNENQGTIPDDGIVIKPGDPGLNEIELPKTEVLSDYLLNSDNIVDNPATDVDEIAIHNKLVEILGKINAYWNTVRTERCKYASSVQVDGVQVTVYLSQKPTTGAVDVGMSSDGNLVIDGVSSDDNIINSVTISIKNQYVGYPYNAINEKLVYIFGSNSDVRYFIEDDIEKVKTMLTNKKKNYDEFVSDFCKINVEIETGIKTVYINKELTTDQKALLGYNTNTGTLDINQPSKTNLNIVNILLVISIMVNIALLCVIVFANKKIVKIKN